MSKNQNTVVIFKFPWKGQEEHSIIGNKLTKKESISLMRIVEVFLTSNNPSKRLKMGKKGK